MNGLYTTKDKTDIIVYFVGPRRGYLISGADNFSNTKAGVLYDDWGIGGWIALSNIYLDMGI